MTDPRLRAIVVALALIGIGISSYLTYVHYAGIEPICAASGGCEKVQSSSYAELAGIPVALLGLIGYVSILLASLAPGELARMIASSLSIAGLGFSLYLTYLELFEIDAICQWCVASGVCMLLLTIFTVTRAVQAEEPAGVAA